MKSKKIYIILIIICIIVFILGIITFYNNKFQNQPKAVTQSLNDEKLPIIENNIADIFMDKADIMPNEEELQEIETLKSEIGSNANAELYKVAEEYDGRKTIIINPSIQFQVALAGALKQGKPQQSDIKEQLATVSQKAGVFITKNSRQAFRKILEDAHISGITINESGYLENTNQNDIEGLSKEMVQMIENGKTYIIDISGTCYMRDDVSGEIIEYPFEQMDPTQICEPFVNDNYVLLVITSNSENLINSTEIIQAITQY